MLCNNLATSGVSGPKVGYAFLPQLAFVLWLHYQQIEVAQRCV